jgi:hypothetical protein
MRRSESRGTPLPCDCVFRTVFRACHNRFRECVQTEKRLSMVTLERSATSVGKCCYGRKIEEYMADFCNLGRRLLDDSLHQVFRFHFVMGADWRLCCKHLNVDRGTFFHKVYRIESILGRAFREIEPYALFPLDEYFGTVLPRTTPPVVEIIEPNHRRRRRRRKSPAGGLLLKIA